MEDKFNMNLQLFTEVEDNDGEVNGEEKDVLTMEEVEILKSDLKKEYDKKLEDAKKQGMSEAERLAKLTEEEKLNERLKGLEEENERYRKERQIRELKDEAIKYLEEEKLPASFVNMVLGEDAELTKNNIKVLKEVFLEQVQVQVEERLKGSSPSNSNGDQIKEDVSEVFKKALKGGF